MPELLVEILKLVIAGALGGWIASQLNWRAFRRQAKYQDVLKRRDALRDVLGTVVDETNRGLTVGWGLTGEAPWNTAARIMELREPVSSAIPLFPPATEASRGLIGLRNLIGVDAGREQRSGVDSFAALSESKERLQDALAVLDEGLYGHSRQPWWRRLFSRPPE